VVVVESAIESHGGCPRCDSSICLVGFSLKPRMQKGDWHFRQAPASAESTASHRRDVSGEAFRIGGCASSRIAEMRFVWILESDPKGLRLGCASTSSRIAEVRFVWILESDSKD